MKENFAHLYPYKKSQIPGEWVLKSYIGLYYVLLVASIVQAKKNLLRSTVLNDSWKGLLYPLNIFGENFVSFDFLFTTFILFGLFCFLFPTKRWLRFGFFINFLMLFNLILAFGRSNSHSFHSLIFFSFFMIFMDEKNISKCQAVMKYATGIILCHYGVSGLWKLNSLLFHYPIDSIFENLKYTIPTHLAYAKAEGNLFLNVYNERLSEPNFQSALIWLSVIMVETGALVAVFKEKWKLTYLFIIFLLHLSIGLIMGIQFYEAMLCILYIIGMIQILFFLDQNKNLRSQT